MTTSVCPSVCLSVRLSTRISTEPHARSLPIYICMLPLGVALSSSGTVTKPKGKGQFWWFSYPMTIHYNAFPAKGIGMEGGDGSSQRGRSVIYDCLVFYCLPYIGWYSHRLRWRIDCQMVVKRRTRHRVVSA